MNLIKKIKKLNKAILLSFSGVHFFYLLAFPASTNYQLRGFEFGSGGDYNMNSASYSLEGLAGEVASERQNSSNYAANSGLQFVQMAHTPGTPTLVNENNWYDKLRLTLSTSNNPSDTLYAVAISTDNFSTTNYVQSDGTIGTNLGLEDFLSYASWGGASGSLIIGLESGTTYYIKVKARQGKYTEGPFGPIASASTVSPSISLDVDIASSDTESSPPYAVAFGDLAVSAVTTAVDKVWIDFQTNAYAGGSVYVKGQNTGLTSAGASYTITSSTSDLASVQVGYGLRGLSASQSSGGPFVISSPYNGSSDNVGILDATYRQLFTSNAPIIVGRASGVLKAKITGDTPASDDYTDVVTVIAAALF